MTDRPHVILGDAILAETVTVIPPKTGNDDANKNIKPTKENPQGTSTTEKGSP